MNIVLVSIFFYIKTILKTSLAFYYVKRNLFIQFKANFHNPPKKELTKGHI